MKHPLYRSTELAIQAIFKTRNKLRSKSYRAHARQFHHNAKVEIHRMAQMLRAMKNASNEKQLKNAIERFI